MGKRERGRAAVRKLFLLVHPPHTLPHQNNSLVPVQGLGGGHGLQELGDLGGAPVKRERERGADGRESDERGHAACTEPLCARGSGDQAIIPPVRVCVRANEQKKNVLGRLLERGEAGGH